MQLALLFLIACRLSAAVTWSQASTDRASNSTGSNLTSLSTAGTNHAAGNMLAVWVRVGNAGQTITISNTAGDTWTGCAIPTDFGGATAQWFYTLSTDGNASDIVTASFGSSPYDAINVYVISGAASVNLCSGAGVTSGFASATVYTSATFSTSAADEAVFYGCVWGALGRTVTAGTGYTAQVDAGGMMASQARVYTSIQSSITTDMTLSSAAGGECSLLSVVGLAASPRRWSQIF